MNVSMHGKAIDYIDLNPVWTPAGNPERIETGNGIALSLSATHHGDHDEFWVIESKGGHEVRRFNTRGIQHIKWSAQETSPAPSPSVMDRLVTVCGACETAACWQGSFMCDSAEMAGIKNLTVRDLHEKPRGENAEYWFKDGDGKIDKALLEIYQRMTSQNR